MREIKFRAWDKNLKKFHYPDLWDNSMPSNWRYWYELNQWTGLKDKNGIEIYEGDILRPRRYKNTKTYNFPVVFKNGKFMFEHKLAGYQTLHESLKNGKRANNDFEVIGNIYENPELLKGA